MGAALSPDKNTTSVSGCRPPGLHYREEEPYQGANRKGVLHARGLIHARMPDLKT